MKLKTFLSIVLSASMILGVLGGCDSSAIAGISQSGTAVDLISAQSSSDSARPRTPATLDLTGATQITLSGSSISVEGSGAEVDGSVVTITAGGVYAVSGTLEDGRILVNAGNAEVTIALNGADITCSYGSPLYVYSAKTATVHLVAGMENTLTDGADYTFADNLSSAADEEPNACLYSKDDLVIEGAGTLTVNANYNNGITSKDTLEVYDGTIIVNAVNHGVSGKDSNAIDSVTLTVSCGGDAIRSTNNSDETLGWVKVSNSELTLTAEDDGIQAETSATLSSGTYSITSGGGCSVSPREDASAKGVKAGTDLTLTSGVYVLDCSDDALHANGNVTISGGVYTISTGDDAIHADGDLAVSAGTLDIQTCYEGLEGTNVTVTGGNISIVSSDDGVNAAGGTDGSGFGGHGMGNAFTPGGGDDAITISGGTIRILAGGDGLDSNGTLTITDGTIVVTSTGNGDSAIDYDGSCSLAGGVLFAAGSGNMMQTPGGDGSCVLSVGFGQILDAGTCVQFSGDGYEYVFQLTGRASSLLFSAPELAAGGVCTISYGGEYSGQIDNGLCTGGDYSGGTVLTELTLEEGLTSYGQTGGMGGGRGGMGGQKQQPQDAGFPPEGIAPDDGEDFVREQRPAGSGGRGDRPDDTALTPAKPAPDNAAAGEANVTEQAG